MLPKDDACHAIMHGSGTTPVNDLYFHVYSRYSGRESQKPFNMLGAETGKIEHLEIDGIKGNCFICGWWMDNGKPRWLVSYRKSKKSKPLIAVIDIDAKRIMETWTVEQNGTLPTRLAGEGLWFLSGSRGILYKADPAKKRLVAKASNPAPIECRCLAVSPQKRLGTYSNDCGFAFTYDLKTGKYFDNGRVYEDDHRCNYGPAAFGGNNERFFIANLGQGEPRLWVTDTEKNRHWQIGDPAVQLVRFKDGVIWGIHGKNPSTMEFEPGYSWIPAWCTIPGTLFYYIPESKKVKEVSEAGLTGLISEIPDMPEFIALTNKKTINIFNKESRRIVSSHNFTDDIAAIVPDNITNLIYAVLSNGEVHSCFVSKFGNISSRMCAEGFGPVDRGCFILSKSKCLAGLSEDGAVSLLSSKSNTVIKLKGPRPMPAGPAVDPEEDAWYFADRCIMKYTLKTEEPALYKM